MKKSITIGIYAIDTAIILYTNRINENINSNEISMDLTLIFQ
jgi:hypothetical protein